MDLDVPVLVLDDEVSLSRLSIGERLGGGGQGRCHQGELDGMPCAVKIMHPSMARRDEQVAEFLKEAHLLARLSNGNIIRVMAIAHLPPAFCGLPTRRYTWGLVLELAKWGPLADVIRTCQSPEVVIPDPPISASPEVLSQPTKTHTVKFAEPEDLVPSSRSHYTDAVAVGWCLDVARALHYLHSQKPAIIHRDVKPDNILLIGDTNQTVQQAVAKLADFGSHVVLDAMRPGTISIRHRSSSIAASESTVAGVSQVNHSMGSHHSLRSASITTSRRRAGDLLHPLSGTPASGMDAADRRSACSSYAGATVESTAAESLARRLSSFLSARTGIDPGVAGSTGSPQGAHSMHSGPIRDGDQSPVTSSVSTHPVPWRHSTMGVDGLEPSTDTTQLMVWEPSSPVAKTCASPVRKKSTLGLPNKTVQSHTALPMRSVSQAALHRPRGRTPVSRANSTMDSGDEDCTPWTGSRSRRTATAATHTADEEELFHMERRLQERPTAPNPSAVRYPSMSGEHMWHAARASSISGTPVGRTDASVLAAALQSHMSAHLSSTSAASNTKTNHPLSTHGSSGLNTRKPRSSRASFTAQHSMTINAPTPTSATSPMVRSPSARPAAGSNPLGANMTRMSITGRVELNTVRPSPHSSRPSPSSVNISKGPSFSMPGGPIESLTSVALAAAASSGQGPLIHQYLEGAVAAAAAAMPERDSRRAGEHGQHGQHGQQVLSILSRGGGLGSGSDFTSRMSEDTVTEPHTAPQVSSQAVWMGTRQDAINEDSVDVPGVELEMLSHRPTDSPSHPSSTKTSKRLRSNPSSFSVPSIPSSGTPQFRQVASIGREGPMSGVRLVSRPSNEHISWAGRELMTRSSARTTTGSPGDGEYSHSMAARISAVTYLPHRHSNTPYTAFNKEHGSSLLRRLQQNLPQTSLTSEAEEATDTVDSNVTDLTAGHGQHDRHLRIDASGGHTGQIRKSLEQPTVNTSQGGSKHSKQRQHTASTSNMGIPGSGASLLAMPSSAGRGSQPASAAMLTDSDMNAWSLATAGHDTLYALTGRAGTSLYMSPEVAQEELYNEKSDVYSFAIVMYEVLSRMLLLSGRTRDEVEYLSIRIQAGHRPRRTEWIQDDELWGLITWCWSQDPSARPNMGQVVEKLSTIHQDLLNTQQIEQEAPQMRNSQSQRLLLKGNFVSAHSLKSSKGNLSLKSRTSRTTVNTGIEGDRTSATTTLGTVLPGTAPGNTLDAAQQQNAWDDILEPPQPQPACCSCTIS